MTKTLSSETEKPVRILNAAVIVAALGYFVDIYDLLLFGIVRTDSLKDLGITGDAIRNQGEFLISMQMFGMLFGGILWGILGDKKGRISVLFGSILIYSVANIANGMVTTVDGYAFWRLIAGIGLAGELGAGITLVTESLPKEKRGYGTMIVASVGVSGAVVAYLVYQIFQDWRLCYYAGGILGLLLLFLRISISESGMFKKVLESDEKKGDFLSLFTNKKRFSKYVQCILIGIPLWFLVGVLITFSPEFAKALGVQNFETIAAGKAIAWCYGGLIFGDIASGLLSQWLKSRKKVMYLFLTFNLIMVYVFLNAFGITASTFYLLCFIMGFSVGYWVLFVTIAAEQFGTNIRATVTTTVPNFVRGSLPLIIIIYGFFRDTIFNGEILKSAMIVGTLLSIISILALRKLNETFHTDLNYSENETQTLAQ
ncbi:MFS transporter [Flavobacterium glaciei]|uniref:MFS family arabinose efflux permease n=1 Tax=Flavobacterium glaciei TaxID=386300 RepID=A0A562Q2N7_9FLAO|nr:MFS transporter [Flavobacterium glaciei]RDI57478.1 putative MFS family arabinose efflux permease [Flavobacterium glaciei]TWI50720.1 putative MFS family arabinose efflux permease [Flavobacterium glaciei]